jgi:hypothetical protein
MGTMTLLTLSRPTPRAGEPRTALGATVTGDSDTGAHRLGQAATEVDVDRLPLGPVCRLRTRLDRRA